MKYWKGLDGTPKEGQFGTMDNDGYVPDSVEIVKAEYVTVVASQPIVKHVDDIVEYEDINTGKMYRMKRI